MTKRKLVDNLEKIAKTKTEEFGIGKIQNELVNNIVALSWKLRVLAATSSMFGEFGVGSHSTHAASDSVRLADRNYELEILESAAGGSVTEQKDTETIHGEDKREEEYVSFYKSMSGDWEDHSPVKLFSETNEVYASFYKSMSGDWEDHSPVKLLSATNEEHASLYKSWSNDWEDHSPQNMRHFPWWIPW